MRWTDQPIYFIDFEGSRTSGVLEYGIATLMGGRVSETRTRLCSPTGRVRPEDTAIHGLTDASLAALEPFSADWEVFAGHRERGPLAAHYSGAEHSLITAVWPYPRTAPDFARPGARGTDWGPWIDTARIYSQLYPDLESGRLEVLVGRCGLQGDLDALAADHCPVGRRRYHAALYDAIAGALLLGSLARHAQMAALSVSQLMALSTLNPKRRESIVQRELF